MVYKGLWYIVLSDLCQLTLAFLDQKWNFIYILVGIFDSDNQTPTQPLKKNLDIQD